MTWRHPRTLVPAAVLVVTMSILALAGTASLRLASRRSDSAAEMRVETVVGATVGRLRQPGGTPRIVVTSVASDSPARAGGLKPGDTIVAADQQPVRSAADLARRLPAGTARRFTIDRNGARIQLVVKPRAAVPARAGGVGVAQVADRRG